jgi:hypothetical protein
VQNCCAGCAADCICGKGSIILYDSYILLLSPPLQTALKVQPCPTGVGTTYWPMGQSLHAVLAVLPEYAHHSASAFSPPGSSSRRYLFLLLVAAATLLARLLLLVAAGNVRPAAGVQQQQDTGLLMPQPPSEAGALRRGASWLLLLQVEAGSKCATVWGAAWHSASTFEELTNLKTVTFWSFVPESLFAAAHEPAVVLFALLPGTGSAQTSPCKQQAMRPFQKPICSGRQSDGPRVLTPLLPSQHPTATRSQSAGG